MYAIFYGFSNYKDRKIVEYPERARGIKVKGNRPKNVSICSDQELTADEKEWVQREIRPKLHHKFNHILYNFD